MHIDWLSILRDAVVLALGMVILFAVLVVVFVVIEGDNHEVDQEGVVFYPRM